MVDDAGQVADAVTVAVGEAARDRSGRPRPIATTAAARSCSVMFVVLCSARSLGRTVVSGQRSDRCRRGSLPAGRGYRGSGWQCGHQKVLRWRGGWPNSPVTIGCAAPAAGLPGAHIHPVLLAASGSARGRLFGVVAVRTQRLEGGADDGVEFGHVFGGRERVHAGQEHQLGCVHVADPGQVALVEQGFDQRTVVARRGWPRRGAASQSGPRTSGPRWPTQRPSSSVRASSRSCTRAPLAVHSVLPMIARTSKESRSRGAGRPGRPDAGRPDAGRPDAGRPAAVALRARSARSIATSRPSAGGCAGCGRRRSASGCACRGPAPRSPWRR